ncbi:hypothetical protein LJB42_004504 [Komagataella kurtzmanii]|nr:hypothetical protein LJB42_004504 [Komagataella kurtzmanii]
MVERSVDSDLEQFEIENEEDFDKLIQKPQDTGIVSKITNSDFFGNNLGLLLIVISKVFNSVMIVCCKLLEMDPTVDRPIHALEILSVRMFLTYICCYAYMHHFKTPDYPFGPKEWRLYGVMRGVFGFSGVFGMYFSLQYLTVPDAVVITFLIPSVVGILARIFLHERFTKIEAWGALVSFLGVLLIARPPFLFGERSSDESDHNVETSDPAKRILAVAASLMGVVGASSVTIVIKHIGKNVHPLILVSYFSLITFIISTVSIIFTPGLGFHVPQTLHQWFLFILIGISGFFMQFLLTEGIQRERKASRSALMFYTEIVFAICWDYLIWKHAPNTLSWIGISIIVTSALTVVLVKDKGSEVPVVQEEPIFLDDIDIRN